MATDLQNGLDAAHTLQDVFNREGDKLHANGDTTLRAHPSMVSPAASSALFEAQIYIHHVILWLAADVIPEAREAFNTIDWKRLRGLVEADADVALATEVLEMFFAARPC